MDKLCAFVGAAVMLATSAHGADLSGRVELFGRNGKSATRTEAGNVVVYFRPARSSGAPLDARTYVLATEDKQFRPHVLPITVGSTVRFPNADPILHNVFSVSLGNVFDVGLYGEGEGVAHVFEAVGLVRVYCNVHHSMFAYILVLDTPYFVRPDADGAFRLGGLPAGSGTLTVWHEGAEPWAQDVEVPGDTPLAVRIEVTRRRVPRHLNKLWEPYPRGTGDRYD